MTQKILHLIKTYILIFTTCLLLATMAQAASVEPPKNPNSAKGCAICHYRWIDTFFIEGKGSDLVEYASEKVVATREMCFSCHDGSVKDSRVKLINGNEHKTNMPPPAGMKIPEIFPLDKNGKMQCATCHTAHGVPSGPDSHDTIFMRISNKDSAMCRKCHPEKNGGIDSGNHPVGNPDHPIPKKLIDRGAITSGGKNPIICETCHTAHGSPYESFLIDDAGNSALCLDCHDDKNLFTPDGKRNPFHVINVIPQKATIPASLIKKGAKLGHKGSITCQTCHKIHNNRLKKPLLLIENDEKSTLCLTCHSDKISVSSSKHNLVRSAPREKNLEGHTASEAGVCSACHLPHRPARALSGKKDFSTQLCMSCHGKGAVAAKKGFTGSAHPLNINPFDIQYTHSEAPIIDVEENQLMLPLFNKFGVQDKNGKMTCSTCHNPHESRMDSTNGKATRHLKENQPTYFLRKQAPNICGECHGNKFFIANSKHDLSKVAPESKNILNQTPSESGLCRSCHAVHGGNINFMWAREITSKSGNTRQDLCMSCHNEQGISKTKITTGVSHTLNISPAEKGLTATLPLFQKNGKMSKDGDMTCSTCHDAHKRSPVKSKSSTDVSIGGRPPNHFLRIEVAPNSDLCISCHKDKVDVLYSDHNLLITAPDNKNALGWTPHESGVCGVCHIVHKSSEKIDLWAMAPGTGSNVMERMCNSCHSQNGAAAAKVPVISSHPDTLFISVWERSKKDPQPFPFFDTKTGRLSPVGNISCPSCHDVHHWAPTSTRVGLQKNIEGDALTSFLRPHVPDRVCRYCHGLDGLFVFKFFHDPAIRNKKEKAKSEN
jgi:predicted CXXCH cytochrome family protein